MLTEEGIAQAHFEAEMELARRVQLRLLPKRPPDSCELDIAAESCPAWQVGGDFYDFIFQPDRPFIFIVGDVTGKGLSAALLMSMTRTVMRSAARFSSVCTPKVIMDRANVDLYDDFTETGMFATAFIGMFQSPGEELVFGNAGHSPVVYCPNDGPARLLEADGTAMGVLPHSTWENHRVRFEPGDLLVVGTDGLNEARNEAGEMFGYQRLLGIIESHRGHDAQSILDALYEAVRAFAGTAAQDDDQTAVVLKRRPQ